MATNPWKKHWRIHTDPYYIDGSNGYYVQWAFLPVDHDPNEEIGVWITTQVFPTHEHAEDYLARHLLLANSTGKAD